MTNLEKLWDYQSADVAVDRLQNEMKRSPTRIKLLKCRENLEEQQKNYKRIESEISVMADRLEALKDALTRAENSLKALQTKIETAPATNSEEAAAYIADVRKLRDSILNYEKEISKIRKDAQDREKQQHDVKVKYAKYKNEFAALKEVYDAEYAEKTKELEALKAVVQEKAKDIPADLMEKYQQIKHHSVPPLSKLTGDKCGGCNMNLPSGAVRSIKNGEFVECETCGRLVTL
ncbi:MAG: hypothetical protein CW338_09565 [Clostridiales bacterium]|nr:hypothetical protein [Clostridiales bacterium]